jgi:hypothetical protein
VRDGDLCIYRILHAFVYRVHGVGDSRVALVFATRIWPIIAIGSIKSCTAHVAASV